MCGQRTTFWLDGTLELDVVASDLAQIMNVNWRVADDHIGPDAVAEVRRRLRQNLDAHVARFRSEVLEPPPSPRALAVWRATYVADEVAAIDRAIAKQLRAETLAVLERALACAVDPEDHAALDLQIRDEGRL